MYRAAQRQVLSSATVVYSSVTDSDANFVSKASAGSLSPAVADWAIAVIVLLLGIVISAAGLVLYMFVERYRRKKMLRRREELLSTSVSTPQPTMPSEKDEHASEVSDQHPVKPGRVITASLSLPRHRLIELPSAGEKIPLNHRLNADVLSADAAPVHPTPNLASSLPKSLKGTPKGPEPKSEPKVGKGDSGISAPPVVLPAVKEKTVPSTVQKRTVSVFKVTTKRPTPPLISPKSASGKMFEPTVPAKIAQPPLPEKLAQPPMPDVKLAQPPTPDVKIAQPPMPDVKIAQPPMPDVKIAQPPTPDVKIAQPPTPDVKITQPPLPEKNAQQPASAMESLRKAQQSASQAQTVTPKVPSTPLQLTTYKTFPQPTTASKIVHPPVTTLESQVISQTVREAPREVEEHVQAVEAPVKRSRWPWRWGKRKDKAKKEHDQQRKAIRSEWAPAAALPAEEVTKGKRSRFV